MVAYPLALDSTTEFSLKRIERIQTNPHSNRYKKILEHKKDISLYLGNFTRIKHKLTLKEIFTMWHEIGCSERVMRQSHITVYNAISESVQLTIYFYFVIFRLCPYFTSKLLTQSVTPEYD